MSIVIFYMIGEIILSWIILKHNLLLTLLTTKTKGTEAIKTGTSVLLQFLGLFND